MSIDELRSASNALRASLSVPIADVEALLELLRPLLRFLGLLEGDATGVWSAFSAEDRLPFVRRYLRAIQSQLIRSVYADWREALLEANALDIFEQCFCPDERGSASTELRGLVALSAYNAILEAIAPTPIAPAQNAKPQVVAAQESVSVLAKLSTTYSLREAYFCINNSALDEAKRRLEWSDAIRVLFSVPHKVSNAINSGLDDDRRPAAVPVALAWSTYMQGLAASYTYLIKDIAASSQQLSDYTATSLSECMSKFAKIGFCSTANLSQPHFWSVVLPRLWHDLYAPSPSLRLAPIWSGTLGRIGTPDLLVCASSLFVTLQSLEGCPDELQSDPLSQSKEAITYIEACAHLCKQILGPLHSVSSGASAILSRSLVEKEGWQTWMGRVVVRWACLSKDGQSCASLCSR